LSVHSSGVIVLTDFTGTIVETAQVPAPKVLVDEVIKMMFPILTVIKSNLDCIGLVF